MARPSTRRSSSRPSRRPAPPSGPSPLVYGLGAMFLLGVAVFFFTSGGGSAPSGGSGGQAQETTRTTTPTPARTTPSVDLTGSQPKAGKTPDRPAPKIAQSDMDRAEELFRLGQEKWNDAQRARQAGDTTTYAAALAEAFEHLQGQRKALETYTDWLDEADFEDWALPAEYVALRKRLGVYDPMYQKVKKLKQTSR
jgi:hypothetical protein